MSISRQQLQRQLLETDAGQAVYDALVQANVDLRTVSLELVKDMLQAESQYRRRLGVPVTRGCLPCLGTVG
jgi:hypothetical protein